MGCQLASQAEVSSLRPTCPAKSSKPLPSCMAEHAQHCCWSPAAAAWRPGLVSATAQGAPVLVQSCTANFKIPLRLRGAAPHTSRGRQLTQLRGVLDHASRAGKPLQAARYCMSCKANAGASCLPTTSCRHAPWERQLGALQGCRCVWQEGCRHGGLDFRGGEGHQARGVVAWRSAPCRPTPGPG